MIKPVDTATEVTSAGIQERIDHFLRDLSAANDLLMLQQVISAHSKWDIYELIHCGVCKIGNAAVKDSIFEKPLPGSAMSVSNFSDELKTAVCNEMLELMEPIALIRHEFQTIPDKALDPVREAASLALKSEDDVFFIPGWHDGAISVCTIFGNYSAFDAHRTRTLIALRACVAGIFLRFPTLITWPEKYKLTERESEALQLATHGMSFQQIGIQLNISTNTVRNHIENAKQKYEARNKTHLTSLASTLGEINPRTNLQRRSKKKK